MNCEQGHWLFPIEDRRDQNGCGLAGLIRGISLPGYLQLVDWSSRLIRPGKVSISETVPDILTRLQVDAEGWKETLGKLLGSQKKTGSYFGSQSRIDEVAGQRGCKYLRNIVGRETNLTSPSPG